MPVRAGTPGLEDGWDGRIRGAPARPWPVWFASSRSGTRSRRSGRRARRAGHWPTIGSVRRSRATARTADVPTIGEWVDGPLPGDAARDRRRAPLCDVAIDGTHSGRTSRRPAVTAPVPLPRLPRDHDCACDADATERRLTATPAAGILLPRPLAPARATSATTTSAPMTSPRPRAQLTRRHRDDPDGAPSGSHEDLGRGSNASLVAGRSASPMRFDARPCRSSLLSLRRPALHSLTHPHRSLRSHPYCSWASGRCRRQTTGGLR